MIETAQDLVLCDVEEKYPNYDPSFFIFNFTTRAEFEKAIGGKKDGQAQAQESGSVIPKEDVPQELQCPICKSILADAVLVSCCGNSFCDQCKVHDTCFLSTNLNRYQINPSAHKQYLPYLSASGNYYGASLSKSEVKASSRGFHEKIY